MKKDTNGLLRLRNFGVCNVTYTSILRQVDSIYPISTSECVLIFISHIILSDMYVFLQTQTCVAADTFSVIYVLVLVMVSSSLYVSHICVTRVLSSLVFQSCPSLELMSPLQVTHLPPVWDLLLPLA